MQFSRIAVGRGLLLQFCKLLPKRCDLLSEAGALLTCSLCQLRHLLRGVACGKTLESLLLFVSDNNAHTQRPAYRDLIPEPLDLGARILESDSVLS